MLFTLAAAGLLFVPSAHAFFRLPCTKPVVDARIDPIVSPGGPSGHAHTIMGGSNIGLSSTFEDMRNSECTTCKVRDDKSAYWISQLYYEFPNKTYSSVSHGGMLVYYLQRGDSSETIQAFPDGLRMLAGDPYARNYTGTLEAQGISYNCLDYSKPATPETPNMAQTNCPDGLRLQVFFPGCWDGKNLDSSDHKSHMAYPAQYNNGKCPSSHPVHLVSIFYELYYSVDPFNKLNAGGRFVLSNGDPTGYGLHGDFLNGWDNSVLSRAVQTCTNDSGVIEDCGVFTNEGRLLTDAENNACSAPNPINEKIDGSLPYLPGCIAVTEGPGRASAADVVPECVAAGGKPAAPAVPAPSSAPAASSTVKTAPSSASSPVKAAPSSAAPASASEPAKAGSSSAAAPSGTSAPGKEGSSSASAVAGQSTVKVGPSASAPVAAPSGSAPAEHATTDKAASSAGSPSAASPSAPAAHSTTEKAAPSAIEPVAGSPSNVAVSSTGTFVTVKTGAASATSSASPVKVGTSAVPAPASSGNVAIGNGGNGGDYGYGGSSTVEAGAPANTPAGTPASGGNASAGHPASHPTTVPTAGHGAPTSVPESHHHYHFYHDGPGDYDQDGGEWGYCYIPPNHNAKANHRRHHARKLHGGDFST